MELSVREHSADCIEFGDVVDRFVHGVVTERIKLLASRMATAASQARLGCGQDGIGGRAHYRPAGAKTVPHGHLT